MRVAHDWEFLEDGRTIEPISVGMVAEDGRELYLVFEEIDAEPLKKRICANKWLLENVIAHLPLRSKPSKLLVDGSAWSFQLDWKSNFIMPRRMIRNAVREFLAATPDLELWGDYAAYDHVALAQLFGTMMDLPSYVPMWTHDLQQQVQNLTVPELGDFVAHNALDDARVVMRTLRWLDER
jgi:hypothetical protein